MNREEDGERKSTRKGGEGMRLEDEAEGQGRQRTVGKEKRKKRNKRSGRNGKRQKEKGKEDWRGRGGG